MADSFIGEIRVLPFNYAPMDWAVCNGSTVLIQQNPALYSVIQTYFGGDGVKNFKLPNLQGQVPMGAGAGPGLTPHVLGLQVGSETVALSTAQMAAHTHTVTAKSIAPNLSAANMTGTPAADSWISEPVLTGASVTRYQAYIPSGTPDAAFAPATFGSTGGITTMAGSPTMAHENRQPYLPMLFCISLSGNYPVHP